MFKINIKDIAGKNTVTRENGERIYSIVREQWEKEDRIILDFTSLVIASVSFMDEAFGQLALDYSREELQKKLQFKNMDENDRALLNSVILSRLKQKNVLGRKSRTKPSKNRK
jgi:hypothetical protein